MLGYSPAPASSQNHGDVITGLLGQRHGAGNGKQKVLFQIKVYVHKLLPGLSLLTSNTAHTAKHVLSHLLSLSRAITQLQLDQKAPVLSNTSTEETPRGSTAASPPTCRDPRAEPSPSVVHGMQKDGARQTLPMGEHSMARSTATRSHLSSEQVGTEEIQISAAVTPG